MDFRQLPFVATAHVQHGSAGRYVEAAVFVATFSVLIPRIVSFLRGFPTSKKGKLHGYGHPRTLVFHIVVSCLMVLRYLYRSLTEETPTISHADIYLGLAQAASSWAVLTRTPFKLTLWKSSFQVAIPLFTFAIVRGFVTQSSSWYQTSMVFLGWFVTIRVAFLAVLKHKMFSEVPPSAAVHLLSVPVTLAWARWSAAIPLYIVALGFMIQLNEHVARRSMKASKERDSFSHAMIALGFGNRWIGTKDKAERPVYD